MPAALPPDLDGRWVIPRTVAEVLEELDLCGVGPGSSRAEVRRVLDLNGVWVPEGRLSQVLRVRAAGSAAGSWTQGRGPTRVSSLAA